ncbi:ubiquinol oxidase subunit II [Reinekea thalattae]|uniref:Ubiquinol oxidase subunit 2 n=1 Tax=Reinekea thalattae TaxID=2593301 RepID=A0A5C8ZAJ5_9GAMM|nr:ubiquinol oxidase subunit II [Reinekea thalattae]TXR53820.1 ubiquinol oxidase subunit II [Reinekea thalattae]
MKVRFINKIALALVATVAVVFLGVLFSTDMVLFDPKGSIGSAQKALIITSVLLMAIVIVPVLFMAFYFPYKYRHTNKDAEYKPNWEHSTKIEIVVWTVPCLIIAALGWVTYQTSHSLDPRQEIVSDKPPLTIQVVAMNWKWLFIYPEHEIATVNEVSFPVDRPVEFLVTSDATMNSFFIPQLGSQVYAMAGMENRLNLMATEAGSYRGMSANYSGFGFANMRFQAHVTDEATFNQWVEDVQTNAQTLDDAAYAALKANEKEQIKKPHPVTYYTSIEPLRFKDIIETHSGVRNGL